jgi:hypothetical protein
MTSRPTTERLAWIRAYVNAPIGERPTVSMYVEELLAELDAVTRERDDARHVLRRFVRDISGNYDHDADAHRYGHADTQCRVCKADAITAALGGAA